MLTYDDGPEPGSTDRVLDVLSTWDATATFFVLLTRVRRYPALLSRVVAAGHEVGLHGPDHRRLTELDARDVTRRTTESRAELEDVLGRAVTWFRPPYGAQSPDTWRAVTETGLIPVFWGAKAKDWLDITTEERLNSACRAVHPGSILLAHDGFAKAIDGVDDGLPPPYLDRGDFTGRLLQRYSDMGLTGKSLSAALQTGSPVWRTWLTH